MLARSLSAVVIALLLLFAGLPSASADTGSAPDPIVPAVEPEPSPAVPAKTAIDIYVLPHPDDETEVWSLVENRPDTYKVFLFLGRGESISYCAPAARAKALRTQYGELQPDPDPVYRWHPTCPQARMNSTLGVFSAMAQLDPGVPDPDPVAKVVDLPDDGTPVRHCEGTTPITCTSDRTAIVHDGGDRGLVLFLALGDADTKTTEIVWGIRSVLAQRDALGIPADLPIRDIIGGYYGRSRSTACSQYRQVDHGALRYVLYNVNFRTTGSQYGATCRKDDRSRLTRYVTPATWQAMMAVDKTTHQRLGVTQRRYGWMNTALNGWYYTPTTTTQTVLWMRRQSFWKRF